MSGGGAPRSDNESADEVTDREQRRVDDAQRRKSIEDDAQARAIDKLKQYIESFPNGAIDEVPEEEELDVNDRESESIENTMPLGKFVYWPICQMNRDECGGYSKELCKTYGTNGTEMPPSEEQLQQQIRLHTWSDHAKKRNCYWYPFCGKAVSCGGTTKEKCSMYGTGGTTTPPSKSELKDAKARAKSLAESVRNAEKKRKRRESTNS